jgi:hypothetical protein
METICLTCKNIAELSRMWSANWTRHQNLQVTAAHQILAPQPNRNFCGMDQQQDSTTSRGSPITILRIWPNINYLYQKFRPEAQPNVHSLPSIHFNASHVVHCAAKSITAIPYNIRNCDTKAASVYTLQLF